MNYVKRIRDLREDNDLTQTEVAKILNTNQKVYSRYETAENEMPIRHLVALCKFYNVSSDYILGFTNNPKPLPKDWWINKSKQNPITFSWFKSATNDRIILLSQLPLFEERGTILSARLLIVFSFQAVIEFWITIN